MIILKVIYFLGLASCGIQGVQRAYRKQLSTPRHILSAFLSAFGGGLTRDACLLNTHPAVFAITCLPEIIIALGSALLYLHFSCINRHIELCVVLADSLGLAQFITIGVDRALSFKENYTLAFFSGVCTSLGGGIISSILSGETIKKVMCSNLPYRIIDVAGTALYIILIKNDIDQTCAQATIVFLTFFAIFCNRLVVETIEKFVAKALTVFKIHSIYVNWELVLLCVKLSNLNKYFCGKISNIIVLPRFQPALGRPRTFLYYRIRQM